MPLIRNGRNIILRSTQRKRISFTTQCETKENQELIHREIQNYIKKITQAPVQDRFVYTYYLNMMNEIIGDNIDDVNTQEIDRLDDIYKILEDFNQRRVDNNDLYTTLDDVRDLIEENSPILTPEIMEKYRTVENLVHDEFAGYISLLDWEMCRLKRRVEVIDDHRRNRIYTERRREIIENFDHFLEQNT